MAALTRGELDALIVSGDDVTGADTSAITDMSFLLSNSADFNQDISGWDVSSVTSMEGMFYDAPAFNQDISGWDVSSVTNMEGMFYDAPAFNQDLRSWDVTLMVALPSYFTSETSLLDPEYFPIWGTSGIPSNTNLLYFGGNQIIDMKYSNSNGELVDVGAFYGGTLVYNGS